MSDPQSTSVSSAETVASPIDPENADKNTAPAFGWSSYAERINGRFAMVGFIALLGLELWTRQDFFTWLGLP